MYPKTLELLESAMQEEMKKFLELVRSLENDELYSFVRQVATINHDGRVNTLNDIIGVAKNIKAIEEAAENLYTV